MWELDYKESWAQKNWCFWTVVLEKTLESPLDCKKSNQSILKEISPEYSLEGLMLKLKLQYFGHLMGRTDSLEKTLILGKIEGRRRWDDRGWDGWMASPTPWKWVWASSGSWWCTGKPVMLQSIGSQTVGHDWATFTQTHISVQFSYSVVSNSLHPRESQHTRPPCPPPTPRVHSNSRPSSRWCHPTILYTALNLSERTQPVQ